MNTIRRKIEKLDDRGIEHRLEFEGDSGLLTILVESHSVLGGTQRTRIDLNKAEALQLMDALLKFTR